MRLSRLGDVLKVSSSPRTAIFSQTTFRKYGIFLQSLISHCSEKAFFPPSSLLPLQQYFLSWCSAAELIPVPKEWISWEYRQTFKSIANTNFLLAIVQSHKTFGYSSFKSGWSCLIFQLSCCIFKMTFMHLFSLYCSHDISYILSHFIYNTK